jgi:hypothetical protein
VARIHDPWMNWRFDHARRIVRVTVGCGVTFTELERSLMQKIPGRWFTLGASLWGQDDPPGRRGDSRLFRFRPSREFGQTAPALPRR